MEVYQPQRWTNYMDLLQVDSSLGNILAYYHNFGRIVSTIQILLQVLSQKKTDLSGLDKIQRNLLKAKQQMALPHFIGVLILRLLYIELPPRLILEELHKNYVNYRGFIMLQALARELLDDRWMSMVKREDDFAALAKLLSVVKEQIMPREQKIEKDNNLVSIKFQIANGEHIYSQAISLGPKNNNESKSEGGSKMLFRKIVNEGSGEYKDSELYNMYCELMNVVEGLVEKGMAANVLEKVYLMLGAIIYFETVCKLSSLLTDESVTGREDPRSVTRFRTHLMMKRFQINLNQNVRQSDVELVLWLKFSPEDLDLIQAQQFFRRQKKLGKMLFSANVNRNFILYVSKLIYCIDNENSIGSGSFGTIMRGKALQFCEMRGRESGAELIFEKKSMAIKKLKDNTEFYEQKGYKIERKRQVSILSLIKEVKYCEKIKTAKRRMSFDVPRALIGIDNLVTMQEMFKVADLTQNNNEERPYFYHMTFITFEKSRMVLSDKNFFLSNENRRSKTQLQAIIFMVYRQILQGLHCLHSELNQFYHSLLKRYFDQQGKKQDYQQQAQLDRKDRCGIFHRDIKTANVVLNFQGDLGFNLETMKVQIIDFGMAGIANFQRFPARTNCGSAHYMAPQMKQGRRYGQKVDIWSVGVMLFEHLNDGNRLFSSSTTNFNMSGLITKKLKDLDTVLSSKQWGQVVGGCLSVDQSKRFSARYLLQLMDHKKVELTNRRKQVIQMFDGNPSRIYRMKVELVEDEYDQISVTMMQNKSIQSEKEASNICHYFLGDFLDNFVRHKMEQKLPVLLAALFLYERERKQQGGFSLKELMKKGELLTYEAESVSKETESNDGAGDKKFKFLLIKLNRDHSVQGDDMEQGTFKQISWFQYNRQAGKLIINEGKKLFLSQRFNFRLNSGYNIRECSSRNSHIFQRKIFLESGAENYHGQHELLRSVCSDICETPQQFKVYWLLGNIRERLPELLSLLIQYIKNSMSNGRRLVISQHIRASSYTVQSANKKIFSIMSILEGVGNILQLTCSERQMIFLWGRFLERETQEQYLFSLEFKQGLRLLLLEFSKNNCQMPYRYFYLLALLHFCKEKEEFEDWMSQLNKFCQGREYFLAHFNALHAEAIQLVNKDETHKSIMRAMKLFLNELSPLAVEFQRIFRVKFGLKNQIIQKRWLIKNGPYSLSHLFYLIRKINQVRLAIFEPFRNLLQKYQSFFKSMWLLRWLLDEQNAYLDKLNDSK